MLQHGMKKTACIAFAAMVLWSCGLTGDDTTDKHTQQSSLVVSQSAEQYSFFCYVIKWEACQVIKQLASFGVIDNRKAYWLCQTNNNFTCGEDKDDD